MDRIGLVRRHQDLDDADEATVVLVAARGSCLHPTVSILTPIMTGVQRVTATGGQASGIGFNPHPDHDRGATQHFGP